MRYEEYKQLSPDQKEFWMFERLEKLDYLDKRFASKWVEHVVKTLGGLTIAGVFSALLALVVRHN